MIATIRAELRKLLTVRSTYVILLICVALNVLFSFYVVGWHTGPEALQSPTFMMSQMFSAVSVLGIFGGLVGLLLVTHEYRYNTIMYTLTANRSRTQVLLSKFAVISAFAILFSLVFGFLSIGLTELAISMRGLVLAPQDFPAWETIWRSALGGWGFVSLAFIIAVLLRSQVGAIILFLLMPSTIESLLTLVLKQYQVFLPFSNIANMLNTVPVEVNGSPVKLMTSVLVLFAYIVVGGLVSWILFLRRDAN